MNQSDKERINQSDELVTYSYENGRKKKKGCNDEITN